ncbi:conserved hypothetical protein [Neospora caninum Liverpool]|uniref:Filamin/ABP280 repeat-containing protein n=1 Tax=Neospora caninum (strain Liverpool) TaxID=572307 RepID=F0VJ41_NEOCL|nr:conserved hypothetical protein [Neospora caninum Liverpool]CBZ53752.1 conserved hypothetical protein [Neospora caninum Liverpool]CEL67744.1 TPA: Filamin/ABP280 repeat-containing protein [Neospora caninum Liverpool]|eukprot:XP_003883784.1 conserved hypothetical protein [Neospora caninum Liverpool]
MEGIRSLSLGDRPPGLLGPRRRPAPLFSPRASSLHPVPSSPSSSSLSSSLSSSSFEDEARVPHEVSNLDDREETESAESDETETELVGDTDDEAVQSDQGRIASPPGLLRHRSSRVPDSPSSDVVVEDEILTTGVRRKARHVYFAPSSSEESEADFRAGEDPVSQTARRQPRRRAVSAAPPWLSPSSSDSSPSSAVSSGSGSRASSRLDDGVTEPFPQARSPPAFSQVLPESSVSRPRESATTLLSLRPSSGSALPGCIKKSGASTSSLFPSAWAPPQSGASPASALRPPPGLRAFAASPLSGVHAPDFPTENRRLRVRFAETAAHASGSEEIDNGTASPRPIPPASPDSLSVPSEQAARDADCAQDPGGIDGTGAIVAPALGGEDAEKKANPAKEGLPTPQSGVDCSAEKSPVVARGKSGSGVLEQEGNALRKASGSFTASVSRRLSGTARLLSGGAQLLSCKSLRSIKSTKSLESTEAKSKDLLGLGSGQLRKASHSLRLADSPKSTTRISCDDQEKTASDEKQKVASDEEEKARNDEKEKVASDEKEKVASDEKEKVASDEKEKVASDEKEKVASDEKEKVASDEEEKVASDEKEKVASDEKEKVASDEEEKARNDEKEKVASDEKEKVASDEKEKVASDEKESAASDEKESAASDEEEKVASDEKEKVASDEKESAASDEEEKVASDEKEKVASDEKEKVASDEKEKVASDEEEKVASDEKEKVASDEEEKARNDEKEKVASDEKEKVASDEKEKAGSDEKESAASDEKEKVASDVKEKVASDEKEKAASDEKGEPRREEEEKAASDEKGEPRREEEEKAGNDAKGTPRREEKEKAGSDAKGTPRREEKEKAGSDEKESAGREKEKAGSDAKGTPRREENEKAGRDTTFCRASSDQRSRARKNSTESNVHGSAAASREGDSGKEAGEDASGSPDEGQSPEARTSSPGVEPIWAEDRDAKGGSDGKAGRGEEKGQLDPRRDQVPEGVNLDKEKESESAPKEKRHAEVKASTQAALRLRIASITNLQTSGVLTRRSGRPLPERVRGGVSGAAGAYGLAPSFSICTVAWFPEEDPLEILGFAQGVSWLPGWGLRVSSAVNTRASLKPGSICLDEADVQQELTVPISLIDSPWQPKLALEHGGAFAPTTHGETASTDFPRTGKQAVKGLMQHFSHVFNVWPFLLVSVVQIHPKLSHSLTPENSPFRAAPFGTQPQNTIGPPHRVRYPTKSPVTVVGTAILPLKRIYEGSGVRVDRHQLLFMDIDKAPPVAVHSDGTLTHLQPCRLFRHEVIREMVSTYRESLKRLQPVSLLDLIEAYSRRLSPVGEILVTLNKLKPLAISFGPILGRRWFQGDARKDGDEGRKAMRKSLTTRQLAEETRGSTAGQDDETHADTASYPAAHAAWIEIRKVANVPIYGLTFREICEAELSVVAMWEAEQACPAILRRKSRKITAVTKCEVQPLNFSAIERMSGSEDSLLSCYIRGQVCLPVYPGLDPSVVLYLCLNGKIYANLESPLNLASFAPERSRSSQPQQVEKSPGAAQTRGWKASGRGAVPGAAQTPGWRLQETSPRTPGSVRDARDEESATETWTDCDGDSETSAKARLGGRTKDASAFRTYKLRSFVPDGGPGDSHGTFSRFHCGHIELRVFPCPADGLFMTAAEFAQLNIQGRSTGRRTQSWHSSPNAYGAPMIGPFGKWTAFADDFEAKPGSKELSEAAPEEDEEAPGSPAGARPVCAFFSPAPTHLQPLPGTPPLSLADAGDADSTASDEAAAEFSASPLPLSPAAVGSGPAASPRGSGPVEAQMCVAEGPNLTVGHVGEWNVFHVKARNRRGEGVAEADGALALCFSPLGEPQYSFVADPSSCLSVDTYRTDSSLIGNSRVGVITKTELKQFAPEWVVEKTNGDCVYRVKYKHNRPGFVLMHVTYEGLEIAGSPFEVHFVRGKAVAEACRVVGHAAKICFASPSPHLQLPYVNADEARRVIEQREREEEWNLAKGDAKREPVKPAVLHNYVNQFVVAICDEMGNRVSTGGHRVSVRGSQGANILQVVDEGRGTYRVDYAVYLPKTPLQQIAVGLLEKLDAYAWMTQKQPDVFVPGIAEAYEQIRSLELPVYTEAEIVVSLNEKPVFGCPIKPRICNFVEVFSAYTELDRRSLLGQQVCEFERVLEEGNYLKATRLLWKVDGMADERQLKEEVVRVLENLVHKQLEREDARKREEAGRDCAELLGETSKEREEKRRREVQDIRSQWEDIHLLRELLVRLNKNCADRESLVQRFTLSMIDRLQQTETCNLRILAEHHNMQRLEQENLVPLAQVLQAQYISMFKQMTQEIVTLVRDVESNQFTNLELLLQAYRRIGVQLRRLHRYQLANRMDEINECVVEEIELQRLAHIARAKEEKIQEIEKQIAEKEEALEEEKKKYEEAAKTFAPLDMDQVRELITTKRQAGVQTEDALSLRQGIFGPLIVARATGQHLPKTSAVVNAVKKAWKSCHVFDIHTTIKRLLKNCPRLKHCIKEVFLHYANVSEANVSNLQSDGLPVGLPQLSFLRFCNDARLEEHLLADRTALQDLFEKFSVEPDTGRIRADGFLRVIPVFLWLPCLRELAYLDLLHVLSREALEEGQDPRTALHRSHPSRLTAFHYFCRTRFLPLYQMLYNNDDFRLSSSLMLETELASGAAASAGSPESRRQRNIWAYAHEHLPGDVFSMLKLEPMEHLFVFYSELSVQPALTRKRGAAVFPTAAKSLREGGKGDSGEPKKFAPKSLAGKVPAGHDVPRSKTEARDSRFVSQTSVETTGAEHASSRAWISLGVLIQMWREFSVIPGFIDCDSALRIARLAVGGSQKDAANKAGNANGPTPEPQKAKEKETAAEETIEFRRLLSMPEIQGDTRRGPDGRLRKFAPAVEAEEGRLYFPNFVETVVNTICECTARALVQEGDPSIPPGSREATETEIKKKAFFLLQLFGINDVSSILLLTRRPLREASRPPPGKSGNANAPGVSKAPSA